ncbi:MAG: ribonuclease Y [bacterium]
MIWISAAVGLLALVLGYVFGRSSGASAGRIAGRAEEQQKLKDLEDKLEKEIATTKAEFATLKDRMRKEVEIEFQAMMARERRALDEELSRRRKEVQKEEDRYREELKKVAEKERRFEDKERSLWQKEKNNEKEKENLAKEKTRIDALIVEQQAKLESIAGLSREEAKAMLLKSVEETARREALQVLKNVEDETKAESKKIAQKIIMTAIQQIDLPQVIEETSVTTIELPSEDLKGRIIGREGRNIRAFEIASGVDLIVDDTPEAVVLSSFDPVRRAIAAIALRKLIEDGRIHPARIEKMLETAQDDILKVVDEKGQEATTKSGAAGLHPELVKYMGRLHFRTSYGQNILNHSVEVSNIAGRMAAELGLNVDIAKRGGFLHDIGKALPGEANASHAIEGAELCKKYGEKSLVVNAVAAHHEEVPFESMEAVIVLMADAVSAVRPGARRESIEKYLKRLEKLEEIGKSFEGVKECYAISAGREMRILVLPDKIGDLEMTQLAKDIARRIEAEVTYPGQIKITVIRERRAVEIAK